MSELLTIMADAYEKQWESAFQEEGVTKPQASRRAISAALLKGADAMKRSGNKHQFMAGVTLESLIEIAEQAP